MKAIKDIKKDFPIFTNNSSLVYLDSSATSQKPEIVIESIKEYYETYNSNVRRGLYPIAEKATQKVEEVRKKAAKFINAKDPQEIIFVRNTTEAINLVMYAWGRKNIKKGDTVTTTIMEHHSNFVPWQVLAQEQGAKLEVIDINEDYKFKVQNSKFKITIQNSKLLAITHVSNVLGTINPIKDIILRVRNEATKREVHKDSSRLRSNNKPLILVDAAQSVPHMKVDVQDLDCDFLAFSGHKMMASTGIGVLYIKKEFLNDMRPFFYGGDMIKEVTIEKTTFADSPFKFEAGTPDIAGIVSLGAAIEYINSAGIENIRNHEKNLTDYCLSLLAKINGITIYGPKTAEERGGVISFIIDRVHPHDIAQVLGDKGICIRSGHHCAMPLHKRLGVAATARASFYIYNDESDIDKFIHAVKEVKRIFKV